VILSVVTFRWHETVTSDQVTAMASALDALVATQPQVIEYRHGPDLGLRPGNADYAIVAGARTVEELQSYLDEPEHQRIVHDLLAPLISSRQSLQIETLDR
jgi:hypothetical protein